MKRDTRDHATRRRNERQEAVRQSLRAWQYIRRMREIAIKCDTVEPEGVPALRLKADIYRTLLGKCLPDLKAVEYKGVIEHRRAEELTDAELAAIITSSRSDGTGEATVSAQESADLH